MSRYSSSRQTVKGRVNEAVAQFQKATQIENSIPEVLAALGHGYAVSGAKAEALKSSVSYKSAPGKSLSPLTASPQFTQDLA